MQLEIFQIQILKQKLNLSEQPDMPTKPVKIIVVTNLWVSFFVSQGKSLLGSLLLSEKIEIVSSKELNEELFEVIQRPKFSKWLDAVQIQQMRVDFELSTLNVEIESTVNVCRYPKDNFLLSLAKDANADFLLTGDADLLTLKGFGETRICTIRDFVDHYFKDT